MSVRCMGGEMVLGTMRGGIDNAARRQSRAFLILCGKWPVIGEHRATNPSTQCPTDIGASRYKTGPRVTIHPNNYRTASREADADTGAAQIKREITRAAVRVLLLRQR